MTERRSRTSRVLRTAEATLIVAASLLLAVTVLALVDTGPQESAAWWLQFLLIALSIGVPALILRTAMRRRRGRLAPPARVSA